VCFPDVRFADPAYPPDTAFYCVDGNRDVALPGYYTLPHGGRPSLCRINQGHMRLSQSDPSGSDCSIHMAQTGVEECPPGFRCVDGLRIACETGSYQPNWGRDECEECEAPVQEKLETDTGLPCLVCQDCMADQEGCITREGFCTIADPDGTVRCWEAGAYDEGDPSSRGCKVCDPSISNSAWTHVADFSACAVDNKCFSGEYCLAGVCATDALEDPSTGDIVYAAAQLLGNADCQVTPCDFDLGPAFMEPGSEHRCLTSEGECGCSIDSACLLWDAEHPTNSCLRASIALDEGADMAYECTGGWEPVVNGMPGCVASDACAGQSQCVDGVCESTPYEQIFQRDAVGELIIGNDGNPIALLPVPCAENYQCHGDLEVVDATVGYTSNPPVCREADPAFDCDTPEYCVVELVGCPEDVRATAMLVLPDECSDGEVPGFCAQASDLDPATTHVTYALHDIGMTQAPAPASRESVTSHAYTSSQAIFGAVVDVSVISSTCGELVVSAAFVATDQEEGTPWPIEQTSSCVWPEPASLIAPEVQGSFGTSDELGQVQALALALVTEPQSGWALPIADGSVVYAVLKLATADEEQLLCTPGIMHDSTPPLTPSVAFGAYGEGASFVPLDDEQRVLVWWTAPEDLESGVASARVLLAAASTFDALPGGMFDADTPCDSVEVLGCLEVDFADESALLSAAVSIGDLPEEGTQLRAQLFVFNGAGLPSTSTSAAAVVDTTPPERAVGASMPVVLNADGEPAVDFVTPADTGAGTLLTVNLGAVACDAGFVDEHSGVTRVEYMLEYRLPGQASTGDWAECEACISTPCSAVVELLAHDGNIVSGMEYRVSLRAMNGAMILSSPIESGWVRADLEPPVAGVAWACDSHSSNCDDSACSFFEVPHGEGTRYISSASALKIRWAAVNLDGAQVVAFGDGELGSGITSFDVHLFEESSGAMVGAPVTMTGGDECATLSGLSLTAGIVYQAAVVAVDAAGLSSATVYTVDIVVDETPPDASQAVVWDTQAGTVGDVDHRGAPSEVSCEWMDFQDAGSPIMAYLWAFAIHTDAGDGSMLTGWINAGDQTTGAAMVGALSGAHPATGVVYECRVKAVNAAGLESDPVASDGVEFETSPPAGGYVWDGTDPASDATVVLSSDTAVAATWGNFEGLSLSYKAIAHSCDVDGALLPPGDRVDMGIATAGEVPMPAPAPSEVCVSVFATSAAGSDVVSTSDGMLVCASGASAASATVRDGPAGAADISYVNDITATPSAHWDGFSGGQCGAAIAAISGYSVSLERLDADGLWEALAAEGPITATEWTLSGSAPGAEGVYIHAARVRSTVCAISALGQACASSDGVLVDTQAPSVELARVKALDPLRLTPATAQSARSLLAVSWSGFSDAHSGVAAFRYGVGSTPNAADVVPLADAGLASFVERSSGLAMADGEAFYVIVEASDRAGNVAVASSQAMLIDGSPPPELAMSVATANANGELVQRAAQASGQVLVQPGTGAAIRWDSAGIADAHSSIVVATIGLGVACGETSYMEHTDVLAPGMLAGLGAHVNGSVVSLPVTAEAIAGGARVASLMLRNAAGLYSMSCSPVLALHVPAQVANSTVGALRLCDPALRTVTHAGASDRVRVCMPAMPTSARANTFATLTLRPLGGSDGAAVAKKQLMPPLLSSHVVTNLSLVAGAEYEATISLGGNQRRESLRYLWG
jgi:hypothetical protein